ncbi:MAG: HlyC/CorC family transporter [Candidatus Hydrogenedentes bacterium]|nr:HlyC/CorC family transporter [Candidatus Hydrogenedentota bacterium]
MAHGSVTGKPGGTFRGREVERRSAVDECSRSAGSWKKSFLVAALWVSVALFLAGANEGAHTPDPPAAAQAADAAPGASAPAAPPLTGPVLAAILGLLSLSAFFSACEVAYFSLGPLRVRAMGNSEAFLDHQVARLMRQPGELLTSILMGNSIVNVLLSVVLAFPVETLFERYLPEPFAYLGAVFFCAALLVFIGEIIPKLLVVRNNENFARVAALPLMLANALLQPLRHAVIFFIGYLFRVTRFSQVRPAPFMTDDEFVSLLSEGEATGAIEKDEREMIQGILKVNDVMVRDILVPRPDMIAISEEATAEEALSLTCEHAYSRIPVYRENLDQIAGVLYAKDLLAFADQNALEAPIKPLIRKVNYVPETMTVLEFMKSVQRLRTHLAIVVDEFGGTEGLITLHDALREIVGDIEAEDREDVYFVKELDKHTYEVDGSFPLDELETITGFPVEDEEHTTVAGFLMEQSDKVLEVGDRIDHEGVLYTVEAMDGKRVSRLLVQTPEPAPELTNGEARE